MILKQFQEVLDIDGRITSLHEELFDLYRLRASILSPDHKQKPTANKRRSAKLSTTNESQQDISAAKAWAAKQYDYLSNSWSRFQVKLPPYKKVEARLLKAYELAATIFQLVPEYQKKFDLLAVPPSRSLGFPVPHKHRLTQHPSLASDLAAADLPKTEKTRDWRFFLVFSDKSGVYLDQPSRVFNDKLLIKFGYDFSGLGLAEYAALTLQLPNLIDQTTNTVLFRNYNGAEVVPYATFKDGRYFFETKPANSDLGIERFRPAIEVK